MKDHLFSLLCLILMLSSGKMVTFSGQDFYAEQTPLMFSRCSSLGSLSGFEQHSIHDDRSSVVSDFRYTRHDFCTLQVVYF